MAASAHLFHNQLHGASVPLEIGYKLEQFLYYEAELLDSWLFDEWLEEIIAPDIRYWAPVRENRLMRDFDKEIYPPGTAAHFDEGYSELSERVRRVDSKRAWAESPPSRTRHLITNVRAFQHVGDDQNQFDVESSFHVYRTNGERYEDSTIGKRFDVVRRVDHGYGFQVTKRTVVFDMATLLVKNLSLFY